MHNWLFKSLLIFLFLLNSSCQGINYFNYADTGHHGYEDGELIIASLDDFKVYQHQDEISGEVIEKEGAEGKDSRKNWIWIVATIIVVAGAIAAIAIIDDDNGDDGPEKPNGNGMDTDMDTGDVVDMDVMF